jgi:hypothetical protein
MRFRVMPSDGQTFVHEQDAPLREGATFFHPPREPGTHGFFRVKAIEPSGGPGETVVRVDRLDS